MLHRFNKSKQSQLQLLPISIDLWVAAAEDHLARFLCKQVKHFDLGELYRR